MAGFSSQTERASDREITDIRRLGELFEEWPMPIDQKIANINLFIRRQELSYIIAKYEIFNLIRDVKGGIYYFGVYHGAGFMTLANLSAALEPFNHTRDLVGFDTFEGYPEVTDKDQTNGENFHTLTPGAFSSKGSDAYLEKLIELYDANRPLSHIRKIDLVKGDVATTLPVYLEENQHAVASMIYLTMNLYEPTRLALESLWPRMPKGGAVVIHSLNEKYYPGAVRALFDAVGSDLEIKTMPFAPNLAYLIKGK